MTEPTTLADNDTITPFYFQDTDVRGALVKLGNSFVESLNGHDYPGNIQCLLGECLAAVTLMNTHLKTPTRLSLQARGEGALSLLMAESILHIPSDTSPQPDNTIPHQTIRAFARFDSASPLGQLAEGSAAMTLPELLGRAQLVITLEPEEGQRYQGIVAADAPRLERSLEDYFGQSEQLATCIRLATNEQFAAGLLLQRLPSSQHLDADAQPEIWNELAMLAQSIQDDELLQLPGQTVLHRLFHQHVCRINPARSVEFACSCSQQRTAAALLQIDAREIEEILQQDGEIVMDCEFCSARYRFDQAAIDQLTMEERGTRH